MALFNHWKCQTCIIIVDFIRLNKQNYGANTSSYLVCSHAFFPRDKVQLSEEEGMDLLLRIKMGWKRVYHLSQNVGTTQALLYFYT